jgi:bacteriorhodopsin
MNTGPSGSIKCSEILVWVSDWRVSQEGLSFIELVMRTLFYLLVLLSLTAAFVIVLSLFPGPNTRR